MSKKVTFSFSIGYVGCRKEETISLKDLGLEGLEGKELEEEIDKAYEEWVWENLDGNWWIED